MKIVYARIPKESASDNTDLCEGIRVTTHVVALVVAEPLEGELQDFVHQTDEWYQEYITKHCSPYVHVRNGGIDEISVVASEAYVNGIRGFVLSVEAWNKYDHCGTRSLVGRHEIVMNVHAGAIESYNVIKGHLSSMGMFAHHRRFRMEEIICATRKEEISLQRKVGQWERPEDTDVIKDSSIAAVRDLLDERNEAYKAVQAEELIKEELDHINDGVQTIVDGVNYGHLVPLPFGSTLAITGALAAQSYGWTVFGVDGVVPAFHTEARIVIPGEHGVYLKKDCSPKDWVNVAKFLSLRMTGDIRIQQCSRTLAIYRNGKLVPIGGQQFVRIDEYYENMSQEQINLIDFSEA